MKTLWIAMTTLAVGMANAQDLSKTDLEKLQGFWRVVSIDIDGRSLTSDAAGGPSMMIRGDRFVSGGMGFEYEGILEIDATSSPKSFNLKFTNGPEKGNTNPGIYELNVDTWRICVATKGDTRPAKFSTSGARGVALEVLQRAEGRAAAGPAPAKEPAALNVEDVHFEPAVELAGEWAMVSGTFDGQPLDSNFVQRGKRIVEGSLMTVTFGAEVYSKAKYTVDRSKTPAAIDIYNSAGANAGKVQYGIYEVAGKTLRLCLAAPGRERPAGFTSERGDGRTLVDWRLVSAKVN